VNKPPTCTHASVKPFPQTSSEGNSKVPLHFSHDGNEVTTTSTISRLYRGVTPFSKFPLSAVDAAASKGANAMNDAGPSLLLARHEHANAHHNHFLQHQKLHNKRQTAVTTATAQATAVTEVIQTISVVQQVDVNTDGSTFAVQTLPASNYPSLVLQSGTTTTSESPSSTDVTSAVSTALGSQPSSSGQAILSLTSSTEVTSTSIPSSFSSLIPNANSTTGKFNKGL
jgi:hypothetical protein